MTRRALSAIVALALLHAAFYIWYQRPEWDRSWTDQAGYERLGEVLATTGLFTRYPDAPVFVPEVIRTPGYPAFVALVYVVAGVGSHVAVAVAQAFVFAGLCLLVFALARRVTDERTALVAAGLSAIFSPFPYFGALVLTELWTAFAATTALVVTINAAQRPSVARFAWAGVLLSLTTLVRPAFVLLPFFLTIGVPLLVPGQRTRRALLGWAALSLAAGLTLVPWFTYNYVNLGQFTLSPAGGVGRGLWEGSWQGQWSGRVQAQLIDLADDPIDWATLDSRVRDVAAAAGQAPDLMLQYVHEWKEIHDIWDAPTDPTERMRARVQADQEYLKAAIANMRRDPVGHVVRRLTTGLFVLWCAEVPIRYHDINDTPMMVIRLIWVLQVVLLALAGWGAVTLARGGRWLESVLLTLPLIYVTGVHLPLLCEARQSLPVKPDMLVLSAVGLTALRRPK